MAGHTDTTGVTGTPTTAVSGAAPTDGWTNGNWWHPGSALYMDDGNSLTVTNS